MNLKKKIKHKKVKLANFYCIRIVTASPITWREANEKFQRQKYSRQFIAQACTIFLCVQIDDRKLFE